MSTVFWTAFLVTLGGLILIILSFRAEDRGDWEGDNWRRCIECGNQLVRTSDKGLAPHIGHRLRRATALNFNEWLRICLGLL